MRIIVTRPVEDAETLCGKLVALGHEAIPVPLLGLSPRNHVIIPECNWQAIAVTSANAIRCLGAKSGLLDFRLLAVGPQSLAAARAAGFRNAEAHGGEIEGLARFIKSNLSPKAGPILYLSGAATSGDLEGQLIEAGFDCRRVVLYDMVPAETLGKAASLLSEERCDAVMLYSPRTARVWLDLVDKHGLADAAARPFYYCLSSNVAAVLPDRWKSLVAQSPDESAMIALLEHSARTR